jgi:hypothetical protein
MNVITWESNFLPIAICKTKNLIIHISVKFSFRFLLVSGTPEFFRGFKKALMDIRASTQNEI